MDPLTVAVVTALGIIATSSLSELLLNCIEI